MIIIHAQGDRPPSDLAHLLASSPDGVILAGTATAVGDSAPDAVLRLVMLQAQDDAFVVLSQCLHHFRHVLATRPGALRYHRGAGVVPEPRDDAPLTWQADADGRVTACHLSPLAAGSPLLRPAAQRLAAMPMPDTRRFAFLRAVLQGGPHVPG